MVIVPATPATPPPAPPPAPAVPLAYATPPRRGGWFLSLYLFQLAATLPLTLLTLVLFFVFISKFRGIFADFRTELPLLTRGVMSIAQWVVHGFGWLAVLLLAGLAPLPLALAFRHAEDGRKRALAILYSLIIQLIVFAIFFIVMFFAVTLPLMKLMESVSGTPAPP